MVSSQAQHVNVGSLSMMLSQYCTELSYDTEQLAIIAKSAGTNKLKRVTKE